ncbi:Uncharacterized protein FKW44_024677, partial [Caligus rogercresseyi]
RKGVCLDSLVGGINDGNQIQTHERVDGVTTIVYRRNLLPTGDAGDKEILQDGPTSIIWALGKMAQNGRQKRARLPYAYTKHHTQINFGARSPSMNAGHSIDLLRGRTPSPGDLSDYLTQHCARYSGMTEQPSSGLSWYINGYIAPELYLRRDLTYAFRVEGGKDPYSPEFYHPFVITSDPVGGFSRLTISRGKKFESWRVWNSHDVETSLFMEAPRKRGPLRNRDSAILEVTPNITWPDVVYYQSFTRPYMGWKIHIVDSFNRRYIPSSAPQIPSGEDKKLFSSYSHPLF